MALLDDVKNALGVTGSYQDATLNAYITEVQEFLKDAGVPVACQTSGVIARGVADLWNYGAGEGKLSNYFIMRTAQLALKGSGQNGKNV